MRVVCREPPLRWVPWNYKLKLLLASDMSQWEKVHEFFLTSEGHTHYLPYCPRKQGMRNGYTTSYPDTSLPTATLLARSTRDTLHAWVGDIPSSFASHEKLEFLALSQAHCDYHYSCHSIPYPCYLHNRSQA